MGIIYPGGIDSFNEPSLPESTPLSEAGTGTRNHVEHHHDLGSAVVALEQNAAFASHDHSGSGTTAHGNKLAQANTHQSADTDSSASAIHHTLGARDAADLGTADSAMTLWQAAAVNHTHNYNGPSILNQPMVICTSTTRPGTAGSAIPAPTLGMMIYETDSHCVRVWDRYSTSTPVWQILPIGNVPIFRAESQAIQEMKRNVNNTCAFTHNLQDFLWGAFGVARFTEETSTITTINIPEPGTYDVDVVIHWHPSQTYHDESMLAIVVNETDIGKANWEFLRSPTLPWGPTALPGFSQTQRLHFSHTFQATDTLRVVVQHNGPRSSFLWYSGDTAGILAPDSHLYNFQQTCNVTVAFRCP